MSGNLPPGTTDKDVDRSGQCCPSPEPCDWCNACIEHECECYLDRDGYQEEEEREQREQEGPKR